MTQPAEKATRLTLHFIGIDDWYRPVYVCENKLYVDVDPRPDRRPSICTKQGNLFHGEPLMDIPEGTDIVFIPKRDTW